MKPVSLATLSLFLLSCGGNTNDRPSADTSQVSQSTAEQSDDFYENGSKLIKGYFNNDTTTNTWVQAVSEDGKFRIRFPFQPIEDSEIQLSDGKKLNVRSFDLDIRKTKFRDDNLGYMIAYIDANQLFPDRTFDEFADDQSNTIIEGSGAKILWENELKVKGGKGRERVFIVNEPEKLQMRQRLIHYKDRVYVLGVITDYEHLFNYEISNFFRSLEFIN